LIGSEPVPAAHRTFPETRDYHVLLEQELADLHGKDDALLYTSGYVANAAAISTLAGRIWDCIVFCDAANHASIIEGIGHSGAECRIFRHNDPVDLEDRLMGVDPWRPKLLCFESVYSTTIDLARVAEICDVAERYGAITYLDEAQAVGGYGLGGAGVAERDGVMHRLTAIQGSLGNAFGVIGGYIAGSAKLIAFLRSFAPSFIYTTRLPPVLAAGALASIRHLRSSSVERDRLQERAATLRRRLLEAGLPVMASENHIVPILMGDAERCREISDELLERFDIYVQPINYPTVPRGTERLCLTPTPQHFDQQIDHLVRCFQNNAPMSLGCIVDFVTPGVDDGLAIAVGNEGRQAFLEFVLGADADVAQDRTRRL
jgi:5-aminolevulinate synthase